MDERPVIYLTDEEMEHARGVAQERVDYAIANNLKSTYGQKKANPETIDLHLSGAQGEAAVAKYFNAPWNHGDFKNRAAPDVGNFDVRTITKLHHNLIMHAKDPTYRVVILVFNQAPRLQLLGWIMGKDAKVPEYWQEPQPGRPCYLVPPVRLNTINTIPPEILAA